VREIRGALGARVAAAHAGPLRRFIVFIYNIRLRPRVRFLDYSLAGGEEAGSVVEEEIARWGKRGRRRCCLPRHLIGRVRPSLSVCGPSKRNLLFLCSKCPWALAPSLVVYWA
jgi:hypothetical protein